MIKENLPLELLNKHIAELGLAEPLHIESDNDLFRKTEAPARSAVVFLPKSKALIDMTLALVSGMVAENGTIVLAGSNDAGIRSAKAAYEKNIGPVERKIVGNHSALYIGSNKRLGAVGGRKTWRDFLSFSPLIYKDTALEAANLPGVFSAGELDEGTKLLLDHIPYDKRSVLDVGCGAGVIGAIYKKKNPAADVTMTDSSMLAIEAAKETLKKNGIEANVTISNVFSNVEGAFDLVLCNPPFHSGVQTDYSFIERFAAGAKQRLKPDGEVYVVANSFLSYKDTLEKHIGPTEIVADDKKFKVFRSKAR
ncbi:class I SAM-dependent methyltransferase [Candidatus Parcubacteria bacterium]|nr:class I SAM-dependent methyltransferase [Candidatus Parcubacteria bacterium]